jgi:uncharacterized coiled-coil protein SlyX
VLTSQLKEVAAVSDAGAARLNALYLQARTTSLAGRTAKTPIAQSAILNALRSQVAQTYDVVSSTQQQVSQLTKRTRTLDYPFDTQSREADAAQPVTFGAGSGGLPRSPILIWCVPVRGGGIGFVCSKHSGNKTTDVYRAPYDESGVLS